MALCNIVGDLGYLGYAFEAHGFVSLPKLVGALFTMVAHILLLAYGDDQARLIAAEKGPLSRAFFALRRWAQNITSFAPKSWLNKIRARPIGVPFLMLAVNGAALLTDAVLRLSHQISAAMMDQAVLGILITLGTGAFAVADFVKRQKTANILTKTAPSILVCASLANAVLAITTTNGFVMMSMLVFAMSNFAGFFVRLDKEKGQHLHS